MGSNGRVCPSSQSKSVVHRYGQCSRTRRYLEELADHFEGDILQATYKNRHHRPKTKIVLKNLHTIVDILLTLLISAPSMVSDTVHSPWL